MLNTHLQSAAIPADGAARALPPDMIRQLVVRQVAHDFRLDPLMLESATRGSPTVALARQVAMYLAHVGFALNFETVGRLFGRDRTTVAHACRLVEDRREDIWFDCRLATLEIVCRATSGGDER